MKTAVALILTLITATYLSLAAQTISGVASGQALLSELSTPTYPRIARQADIWGEETVLVTVRPDGTVESAVVERGHPLLVLRQAATDSALKSRFQCPECKGNVAYRLVYAFRIVEGANCCEAGTVAPKIEHHPDGPAQSHISIEAEQVCICDPASVATKRVRSLKCLYLWKCSTH